MDDHGCSFVLRPCGTQARPLLLGVCLDAITLVDLPERGASLWLDILVSVLVRGLDNPAGPVAGAAVIQVWAHFARDTHGIGE